MKSLPVNHSRMRALNCVAVLRQLHLSGPMSRIELVRRLSLDSKTLTNLTRELIERKFVSESEMVPVGGRGRPRQMLRLRGENVNALGIHITEHHIRSAIINLNGEINGFKEVPLLDSDSRADLVEKIYKTARQARDSFRKKILGVGIAYPGMFDGGSGEITRCVNLPALEGVRLREVAQEIDPRGISLLENDTRARAMAEYWFGACRNLENYVFIDMGTGIGSAIVRDGKAERGSREIAGELGHITVRENGELCSCGRHGCLETVASLARIQRHLKEGNRLPSVAQIASMIKRGDERAMSEVAEMGNALGRALVNLICILNPSQMILGGQSLALGPHLVASIQDSVERNVMKEFKGTYRIKESELGDRGALLGSVVGLLESFFQS